MIHAEEWLHWLFEKKHGRKWLVLVGGAWGDSGKGAIESAIQEHFKVCVRVSGGANTGRTSYIMTPNGPEEFIFHLVPCGWAYGQESFIGDWVLMDMSRFSTEISQLKQKLGKMPDTPLYISRKAPICLPYHSMWEAYLEYCKGADAVGTTKRGIAPTIAGIDLRIGPRMGHLEYPDALRKWVQGFYDIFEEDFKRLIEWQKRDAEKAEAAGEEPSEIYNLDDVTPDKVTEQLLSQASIVQDFITDIDSLLLEKAKDNIPTIIGLTQGYGLSQRGTYPFNSSTQTSAQAASYCSGIPMEYFGPVVQVEKLMPTRVGWGPFPTGMWDRKEAEEFPKSQPKLFSALEDDCDPEERDAFLKTYRQIINNDDNPDPVAVAKYIQVLLNELGATTKRGREPGWSDLFVMACAAQSNGADVIALTRVDWLSDLEINLKFGTGYLIDGNPCRVPDYPNPIERLNQVKVAYQDIQVNCRGVDLYGATDLPPVFDEINNLIRLHTGVPVGVISTSPKAQEGKIFRDFRAEVK